MSEAPLVLGMAGHVDHGKTALVLALTGRDTDRLPEEKARGISIELGFAPLGLPSGRTVSLVDVPGHERFVRHMVAGASGVDGYLLCVAADDGVMPQTREHMDVLRLLGVADGVVAVTKADLIEPDLAAEEARELVGAGPEIVAVSAATGAGMDDLLGALDRLAARLSRRTSAGRPRLFVDRAFTVAGAGTVVTGTLWGGAISPGDRVTVLPAGVEARVRGIQVHDRPAEAATGGRVALNLAGVEREEAPRGSCVVRGDDAWRVSDLLDVALDWLPDSGGPLRTRRRLQAFLGTAEVPATCVLLAGEEIPPGGRGYAQLRLEAPLPASRGDRLVLRSAERRTVGGATVIDSAPPRHGRGARAAERLAVLERGDPVEVAALRLREAGGNGVPATAHDREDLLAAGAAILGTRALVPDAVAAAREAVLGACGAEGASLATATAASGLGAEAAGALIELLVEEGALARDGTRLVPPGRARDPVLDELAALLAGAGLRPPGAAELQERTGLDERRLTAALAALRDEGRVVRAGDLWFDAAAAAAARDAAAAALAEGPKGLGELRDLWGVGRRHAVALAAHLDQSGLTRRQDDLRVLRRGAASR
jgi:selenocysteine-specific elongation factor